MSRDCLAAPAEKTPHRRFSSETSGGHQIAFEGPEYRLNRCRPRCDGRIQWEYFGATGPTLSSPAISSCERAMPTDIRYSARCFSLRAPMTTVVTPSFCSATPGPSAPARPGASLRGHSAFPPWRRPALYGPAEKRRWRVGLLRRFRAWGSRTKIRLPAPGSGRCRVSFAIIGRTTCRAARDSRREASRATGFVFARAAGRCRQLRCWRCRWLHTMARPLPWC